MRQIKFSCDFFFVGKKPGKWQSMGCYCNPSTGICIIQCQQYFFVIKGFDKHCSKYSQHCINDSKKILILEKKSYFAAKIQSYRKGREDTQVAGQQTWLFRKLRSLWEYSQHFSKSFPLYTTSKQSTTPTFQDGSIKLLLHC